MSFPFQETAQYDESISSWIIRNSISNYLHPAEFLKHCSINKRTSYDFDLKANNQLLTNIQEQLLTGSSPQLETRQSASFKILQKRKGNNFIYPCNSYPKSLLFPPQYCPTCLNNSPAYYKFSWRISLVFGCSICKRFLASCCPKCYKPVQIFKSKPQIPFDPNRIRFCFQCGEDLGKGKSRIMNDRELKLLSDINKLLISDDLCSFYFFIEAIEILINSGRKNDAVRRYFDIQRMDTSFLLYCSEDRYKVIKYAYYWKNNAFNTFRAINDSFGIRIKDWEKCFSISLDPLLFDVRFVI